jgi:class 3 adenylate cyclase
MNITDISEPRRTNLLISFIDIMNFAAISHKLSDSVAVFNLLNEFAKTILGLVEKTSGHVVKFIGDACLLVFPEESVDEGVLAVMEIRKQCEELFTRRSIPTALRINIHFGEVAIGLLGDEKHARIDIMGDSVNVAATLGRGEHRGKILISPQTFRKLSPGTRKLFHKYTPPILYIAE